VVDVHVVAILAVATNTANRRRIDEPKGQGLFPSAFAFCSMTGAAGGCVSPRVQRNDALEVGLSRYWKLGTDQGIAAEPPSRIL
jgi:hypothetical protein